MYGSSLTSGYLKNLSQEFFLAVQSAISENVLVLQDVHYVFVNDTCLALYVPDRNFFPVLVGEQNFDDSSGPKVEVRAMTKIGKRSLRATRLIFDH